MKAANVVAQLERLEDQLQALKWVARPPQLIGRVRGHRGPRSVVTQTAGLLRGRLPPGRTHERQLRREWERARRQRTS